MQLLDTVIKTLELVKPSEVKIYDFEQSNPFYQYVVLATASERQATALVTYFKEALGDTIKGVEGKKGGWLLIDLGDVIVHVFNKEMREYYGFDKRMIGIKMVPNKA